MLGTKKPRREFISPRDLQFVQANGRTGFQEVMRETFRENKMPIALEETVKEQELKRFTYSISPHFPPRVNSYFGECSKWVTIWFPDPNLQRSLDQTVGGVLNFATGSQRLVRYANG